MKTLLFIVALIVSLSCYGGTIDPNISDESYIEYGKNKKFDCVVNLNAVVNKKEYRCSASGVVIKPKWILTAAHLKMYGNKWKVKIKDKEIAINLFISHHQFQRDHQFDYDIALMRCSEPIILEHYPELYKNTDEENKECSVSGYGNTGTFITGINRFDENKRAGLNKINSIHLDFLMCNLQDEFTALEMLTADGDSGGGLFIDNKLAGITSSIFTKDGHPNSDINDSSAHTRISHHIQWIERTINENEKK